MRRSGNDISRRWYSCKLPPPHRSPALPQPKLFINNERVDALSGETFDAINPSSGEVITTLPKGGAADVDRAVSAAREAFRPGSAWRCIDAKGRASLLNRLADLVHRDRAYLASLEALECGKVYHATLRGDLPWALNCFRYFGGLADKIAEETASVDGKFVVRTRHEPIGVCGLLTAWNFSTSNISFKLSPALAAGCTVVLKPSHHGSLSALHIAELVREAGFPPGVVNLLLGDGRVGSAIVLHPDVQKISFTGSTTIGKSIYQMGSNKLKRLTLGLSGKSSSIILPDADLDKAVEHAHFAAFQNMGQCCCAGSKTFVHESIYKEFVEKAKERIRRIRIGDPFEPGIDYGPQATEDHMEYILNMIETGKREGARLELGGRRLDRPGFFVEPTLFTGVTDDIAIAKEEIFGPVQLVLPYRTIDEVIERVNATEYGLAASVFGQNIDQITTIIQSVRKGSVWVNCYFVIAPQVPFGGFKMSGLGREGGPDSLKEFYKVKSVFTEQQ